jgi:hypothetical protein
VTFPLPSSPGAQAPSEGKLQLSAAPNLLEQSIASSIQLSIIVRSSNAVSHSRPRLFTVAAPADDHGRPPADDEAFRDGRRGAIQDVQAGTDAHHGVQGGGAAGSAPPQQQAAPRRPRADGDAVRAPARAAEPRDPRGHARNAGVPHRAAHAGGRAAPGDGRGRRREAGAGERQHRAWSHEAATAADGGVRVGGVLQRAQRRVRHPKEGRVRRRTPCPAPAPRRVHGRRRAAATARREGRRHAVGWRAHLHARPRRARRWVQGL